MSVIWMAILGVALAGTPERDGAAVAAPAALREAASAALAAPDARTLAASGLDDATLTRLAADGDWRVRARAGAALQWRREPAFAAAVAEAAPGVTRNGMPRFIARELREPDASPLLLERLLSGNDDSAARAALVEALPLSGGDWSEAAAGLIAEGRDAGVRVQLAGALRHADAAPAREGLARAAVDTDAGVRAAAMRAIAGREDGATWGEAVVAALSDTDAGVRAAAARAAGWLRLAGAWEPLVARLTDADAEVRLQAVGALERLDAPRAAKLAPLGELLQDRDARVARAAARVTGGD